MLYGERWTEDNAHLVNCSHDRYMIGEKFGEENKLIAVPPGPAMILWTNVKKETWCDFERIEDYLFLHPLTKRMLYKRTKRFLVQALKWMN